MQDYKQLDEIGKKLNDTNFCGVIALATVLDISFKRAKRKLEKLGRKHRKGTYDSVLHKAIKNHGYSLKSVMSPMDWRLTANQAQKKFSNGTYIVTFAGSIYHVATLKDGRYNDWIDKEFRGKAPKYKVFQIYQVTKKEI